MKSGYEYQHTDDGSGTRRPGTGTKGVETLHRFNYM
jgi:hypothetical protein